MCTREGEERGREGHASKNITCEVDNEKEGCVVVHIEASERRGWGEVGGSQGRGEGAVL